MLFLDSTKSNDITNFFVKSILVQTFAFTSVYDMIMPLKQFEKKGPLNVESVFKGVFIQEDLTNQRSKLLKFIKGRDNVDRVQTSDGRLRVTLKEDCGAGRRVNVEDPDDLFKIGIDSADITQFGYIDV